MPRFGLSASWEIDESLLRDAVQHSHGGSHFNADLKAMHGFVPPDPYSGDSPDDLTQYEVLDRKRRSSHPDDPMHMSKKSELLDNFARMMEESVCDSIRGSLNNMARQFKDVEAVVGKIFRRGESMVPSPYFANNKPQITFIDGETMTVTCKSGDIIIDGGQKLDVKLPDGGRLKVNENGSWEVQDEDAKVQYRACKIREFNRYINASDLLEEFIVFLGEFDIKQSEVLNVPIGMFIHFLIWKAAVADGMEHEAENDYKMLQSQVKAMPVHRIQPKCLCCGRYISLGVFQKGFNFCDADCAVRFATREIDGVKQESTCVA